MKKGRISVRKCFTSLLSALLALTVFHPVYAASAAFSKSVEETAEKIYLQVFKTICTDQIKKQNQVLADMVENALEDTDADLDLVGIDIRSADGLYSYTLNEDVEFIAASLYKLPLAMIYYDFITDGLLEADDVLEVTPDMLVESDSYSYFWLGGLEVQEALELAIIYSSNLAGHVLYENLGGWLEYKEIAQAYSLDGWDFDGYMTMDNLTTARYMSDVLMYLLENADEYEKLLEDMKESEPDNYLNYENELSLYQKYGEYESQTNGAGLSMDYGGYVITVLSADGWDNQEILGKVAEAADQFFELMHTSGLLKQSQSGS